MNRKRLVLLMLLLLITSMLVACGDSAATTAPNVKISCLAVVEGNIWVGCSDGSIAVYTAVSCSF